MIILISMLLFSTVEVEPIKIKFASVEEAKQLLSTEDAFTDAWSAFDIDSRIGKAGSSKSDLLTFVTEQALEWTTEEKTKLSAALARIHKSMADQNLTLKLDEAVTLVKTTAKEEGGALGYTRANYIVLAESFCNLSEEQIDKTLVHELFHVISRTNPELRKKLYALIGFHLMPSIDYPEALKPFRITNPDATQTDTYIKVKVGSEGEEVTCMMILYAKGNYEGGSFFKYLNIGFLKLEGVQSKHPVVADEGPVIYRMDEVENFFDQVGSNTQYIIHPEEIMADNFSFAILGREGFPNQELIESIKSVLKSN